MKRITAALAFLAMLAILFGPSLCLSQITTGQTAPGFSLKDVKGASYDLTQMKEHPMIILYFFDAESRPSQEGLMSLDQLAKRYADADLTVWGITTSSREPVRSFI
jgi:peroxiredoxin